jgi:predicted MFS family arabinose efflux permease
VIPAGLCLASLSTAGVNPVTNRATLGVGEGRATLIAVKQSGVALSTVLCGVALPLLASAVGWRYGLAVFSVLCLAPLAFLRAVPTSPTSSSRRTGVPSFTYSTRQLVAYAFLMGWGSSTVTAYIVLFGFHALGLTEARAGMLLSSVGLGSMLGRVVWGSLAVRSTRRQRHLQGHLTSMALLASLAALGLAASERVGLSLAVSCALLMGLSASSWNPLGMMIVTASGESRRTMTMSGQIMFGFFSGLALAPPLFGAIVDAFGFGLGWLATSAVFAIATVTMVRRPRLLSLP